MSSPKNIPLRLKNITHGYKDRVILEGINLEVAEGDLCVLVGSSGCGKSTMLRLMLGQEKPTIGEVELDGVKLRKPSKEIGVVYQTYSLFPHISILDNVLLSKRFTTNKLTRLFHSEQYRSEALRMLDRMGLKKSAQLYPHQLSGGMRQRAALAQALISKPRVLLMDEPFSGLDVSTRESMRTLLVEMWSEFSITVVFVTHDLEEGIKIGTHLVALRPIQQDVNHRGACISAHYDLTNLLGNPSKRSTKSIRDLSLQIAEIAYNQNHAPDSNVMEVAL